MIVLNDLCKNGIVGLLYFFWFLKKCKNKINLTMTVQIALVADLFSCYLAIIVIIFVDLPLALLIIIILILVVAKYKYALKKIQHFQTEQEKIWVY